MRLICVISLILITQISYSFADSEQDCIDQNTTITEKVNCLEDVNFISSSFHSIGVTKVEMTFDQVEDHSDSNSAPFTQRIVLLHRNINEPMLLQTSGYSIFGVRFAAIASEFKTNQLQIEHRFFEKSIAADPNWSHLNITQSAADFHRITQAFKKIYNKPWVNTGASKGGMTSVYHRYFYPGDLAGTVADVAPLSFSTDDQRYITFMENVGGDKYKECRKTLKEMQQTLLINSDQFLSRFNGNFSQLGGSDIAFEHSVIEAPFYFWQYGSPTLCNSLPDSSNLAATFSLFQKLADIDDYKDESLKRFAPYYYQAATELGNPANITNHLEVLRKFEFRISQYTPKGVTLPYSNASMRDVRDWVLNEANDILFVYGELDPWTAAEFPITENNSSNVEKLYVAGGNHSANFTKLGGPDKAIAKEMIAGWLGKSVVNRKKKSLDQKSFKTLEDLELEFRKKNRL